MVQENLNETEMQSETMPGNLCQAIAREQIELEEMVLETLSTELETRWGLVGTRSNALEKLEVPEHTQ